MWNLVATSSRVGGTNTILLRRQIDHFPDAALAFLIAHEAAHLVHLTEVG